MHVRNNEVDFLKQITALVGLKNLKFPQVSPEREGRHDAM